MIEPRIVRAFTVFAVLFGVIAMIMAMNPIAGARAESVYTVRDIVVDSSAASSADARAIALAQGQRAAFDRLLRRLVLSEDLVLLPNLEDGMIAQVVDGYIIDKERLSSTRYRAVLIVYFNKGRVRKLLRQRRIRFAETISKDVLVVPVYDDGAGDVLWQEPGDWRTAWLSRPAIEGLVPFILPLGDVMDMGAVSVAEALAPVRKPLLALAERYGSEEVVVVAASLQLPAAELEEPAPSDLTAELDVADGVSQEAGNAAEQAAPAGDLPTARHVRGPVEGTILQLTVHRIGVAGEQTVRELLRGSPGESKADLLGRAVGRVVAQVEGSWKQANMLRFGRENKLRIIVPLTGLSDWVEMRRRLSELAVVVTVDLAALSRDQAEVLLHYLGETEQLMLGLEQSDLALVFQARGWVLQTENTGATQQQGGKNL